MIKYFDAKEQVEIWHLDQLNRLVNNFEADVSDRVNAGCFKVQQDYMMIVLHIIRKTILDLREIHCLCVNGYPDGAMAIARNLYEQFIDLAFFESHRQDVNWNNYIEDYCLNYELKRLKALRKEREYYAEKSDRNQVDDQELQKICAELRQCKKQAHAKTGKDYWWTGENRSFAEMQKNIRNNVDQGCQGILCMQEMLYQLSCASLHSGASGNFKRLGDDPSQGWLDASPRHEGHAAVLTFAITSFIYIAGVGCKHLQIDPKPYIPVLNELMKGYCSKLKNG